MKRYELPSFLSLRNLLVALTVLAALLSMTGALDDVGDRYTHGSLTRALAGFAVARGLNGVISAAQGTEVSIHPAGIGVTFSPGEILDPLNDLVERFSWVMLASSVSLGIQRLLLELGAWSGFAWSVALLALLCAWMLARGSPLAFWQAWLVRVVWVLVVLRFAVPLMAIVNEGVYEAFLAPQYEEATQRLESATESLRELERRESPPEDGEESLLSRAKRMFDQAASSIDMEARLERYTALASEASYDAVNLIVIFVFQTLLSPLAFLAVLVGVVKGVWRTRLGPLREIAEPARRAP